MEFYINVKNRMAEVLSADGTLPQLVCDNDDHSITFLFDAEWSAYSQKTARFVYRENAGRGAIVHMDVPFTGNSVVVPLFHNVREVFVGVIAGNIRTTTAARITCVPSICSYAVAEASGSDDDHTSDAKEEEVKRIVLALADGDQTVKASEGKTMSAVVIEKPSTLIPDNIRKGVNIAGVVGTYEGEKQDEEETLTLDAPTISLNGDTLTISAVEGAEDYTVMANEKYIATTSGLTVNLYEKLEGYGAGTYTIYVVARNDTTGALSEHSNEVTYTLVIEPEEDLTLAAPAITLSGDTLTISAVEGAEDYAIMANDAYLNATSSLTVDLASMFLYRDPGTYTLYVVARNDTTGALSEHSNEVTYTVTAWLDAPTIALNDSTITVTPSSEGNVDADCYCIYVDNAKLPSVSESTTFDLNNYIGGWDHGTYLIAVTAYHTTSGAESAQSNKVFFTLSGSDSGEVDGTGGYTLTVTCVYDSTNGSSGFYYWKDAEVNVDSESGYTFGENDGVIESQGYSDEEMLETVVTTITGIRDYVTLAAFYQTSSYTDLVNCSVEDISMDALGGNGEAYKITLTGNASITFNKGWW